MKALLSVLAAASMTAGVASWTVPPPAIDHVVRITEHTYSPDNLEIAVGDTVIWRNFAPEPHTVQAYLAPAQPRDPEYFESGLLLSGDSYEHTFLKEGSYKYGCRSHTNMVGRVTVRAR